MRPKNLPRARVVSTSRGVQRWEPIFSSSRSEERGVPGVLKRRATKKWGKLAPALWVAAQIAPYFVVVLGSGVATTVVLRLGWRDFRSQRHAPLYGDTTLATTECERPICYSPAASVSMGLLKQGCSATIAGLRNTLEPDPDNTGVGSFLRLSGLFPSIAAHAPLFQEI